IFTSCPKSSHWLTGITEGRPGTIDSAKRIACTHAERRASFSALSKMKIVGVFCFLVLLALAEAQGSITKPPGNKAPTKPPENDAKLNEAAKLIEAAKIEKEKIEKENLAQKEKEEKEEIVEEIKQLAELVAGQYRLENDEKEPGVADTMFFWPYKFNRIARGREDKQGFILEELQNGVYIRRRYLQLITQKKNKHFKVEYYEFKPEWENRTDDPFSKDTLIKHLHRKYLNMSACLYQEIVRFGDSFVGESYYCPSNVAQNYITITCNNMIFDLPNKKTLRYKMIKRETLPLEPENEQRMKLNVCFVTLTLTVLFYKSQAQVYVAEGYFVIDSSAVQ
ncbi:hypothetical protein Bpfe_016949, partial [Biomphalaria pfeifferi]